MSQVETHFRCCYGQVVHVSAQRPQMLLAGEAPQTLWSMIHMQQCACVFQTPRKDSRTVTVRSMGLGCCPTSKYVDSAIHMHCLPRALDTEFDRRKKRKPQKNRKSGNAKHTTLKRLTKRTKYMNCFFHIQFILHIGSLHQLLWKQLIIFINGCRC